MKLNSLTVVNFRRFKGLTVDFHPDLTVIAARNGKGKTTVLEAAALALGPFVGAFDESRGENIKKMDARFTGDESQGQNEQAFPVILDARFENPEIHSIRELRSGKGATTTGGSRALADYGKALQDAVRNYEDVDLPLVCYYSSKRLWVHHSKTSSRAPSKSRIAGYTDCLSALSSMNQLTQWVRKAELVDLQRQQRAQGETVSQAPELAGVSQAVASTLADEGWSDFRYDFDLDSLSMHHPDHGRLPIHIMSDGIRAMTSLSADIARRACQLNPQYGPDAPSLTAGIVLIDEVDLHLHPEWQQRVLGGLRRTFPHMQFVVSTHSPQVLSSVSRTNIRTIDRDGEDTWSATPPADEIKGLSSEVALSEVMEVSPDPPVRETEARNAYIELIEQGLADSEAGRKLRTELEDTYGPEHRVIRDADRLIRFQALKAKRVAQ